MMQHIIRQQFVLITPQISVTITCGIQPTGVITMAMEVLHNTCNMYTCDLPDIYALSPWAYISGKSYPSCPYHNHYIHTFYKLLSL